jgi:RsiW-degrading membrane proteinase PrsW (M82 family)
MTSTEFIHEGKGGIPWALSAILLKFNWQDLFENSGQVIVQAVLAATVGFFVQLVLKRLTKKFTKEKNKDETDTTIH